MAEQNIVFTFEIAQKIHEGHITREEGIRRLVEEIGMNEGSAKIILIQVFPKLINGEAFTRTLSVAYFEYFVSRIFQDYGVLKLSLALRALKLHIDYIASRGDSKIKLKQIYNSYLTYTIENDENEIDEKEQEEIISYLQNNKSKKEVIAELLDYKSKEIEVVEINHKSYKRDNKIIAQIKFVRDFECQICKTYILKRDGSKYIEAAHITPKNGKGNEALNNIILLCPNHHKEFDYGKREILYRDKDHIEFRLNESIYKINLALI